MALLDKDTSILTPDDVAQLLQVERSWVIDAAYNGRIPALKLGRYWRFERAVLEQWLNRSRTGSFNDGNGKTPAQEH